MVDLETMGTGAHAPIVSIGAVDFDAQTINSEFYVKVKLESAVEHGAVIDADTVLWWLKQEEQARAELTKGDGVSLPTALEMLKAWAGDAYWWGNGASFDNVILAESAKRATGKPLWPFFHDRCYRTMKSCFPEADLPDRFDAHNAVADARFQALHLININRHYHLGIL